MPQFIQCQSLSALLFEDDELMGSKTQADCSNDADEEQSFPQRVHDTAGADAQLAGARESSGSLVRAGRCSGGGGGGEGFSLLKCQSYSEAWG